MVDNHKKYGFVKPEEVRDYYAYVTNVSEAVPGPKMMKVITTPEEVLEKYPLAGFRETHPIRKVSTFEKILFNLYNILGDASLINGCYLISKGNKEAGTFYLITGLAAEGISIAHSIGREFSWSELGPYTNIKYHLPLLNKIPKKDNQNL
jgi:hypothetical protein